MIVEIPNQLEVEGLAELVTLVRDSAAEPECTLDFSRLRFAHPFPSLVLAETLRLIQAQRSILGVGPLDVDDSVHRMGSDALGYLRWLGFFERAGFDRVPPRTVSNPLGAVAITELNVDEAPRVEDRSDHLARLICGGADDYGEMVVSYCLKEVIRNAFEHSRVSTCRVAGQRWKNGWAEVAIVDRGRGVVASLRATLGHGIPAVDVLAKAVQAGISCNMNDPNSGNAGLGLFILSELARRHDGDFFLISHDLALRFRGPARSYARFPFVGTAVMLRIPYATLAPTFTSIFASYVNRGEQIAAGNRRVVRDDSPSKRLRMPPRGGGWS